MQLQNWRRSFSYVLLFMLVLPILAACGGSPAASPTNAPAAEATQAPAAPTAATAAEPTAAPAEPTAAAPAEPTAPAASTSGGAEAGVLRLPGSQPENIDPQQASFVDEIAFIMMNYLPLMTFDLEMKPIPGAAESVDVSADGKVYTFKIRPDSKYSDGSPLTAQNFEFAWKRLADPELAGQYQFIGCGVIEGFSEYAVTTCADKDGNTKTITEAVELDLATLRDGVGVKALDDSTLEIRLVNPAPYFLSMAALWIGAPVREEDAAKGTDWWTDAANYIGNGPFILKEWEPDSKAVWEANPNWPLGPHKIKRMEWPVIEESQVVFQAYKNGELDMMGVAAEDLAAVQSDPVLSKEATEVAGSCTFYLGFNVTKAPFDNIKVRQAFAQAFDRDAWVRDVLQGLGKPAYSLIPPGFPGHDADEKSWTFDPVAAKKTLADAGFADGKGLPEIKLTFGASARGKVRFEWIANQIKQNLGVDVTLDPVEPTAYTAIVKDNPPQMFSLGWCADYPDPQDFLTVVFKTGGIGSGRVGWSNKEFDDLVTQADTEADPAKRAELYDKAQKLLVQEAPVVFTSNDAGVSLVKPYIKGIKRTPLDYIPGFFDLKNIEIAP